MQGCQHIETVTADEQCELLQMPRADFVLLINACEDLEHSMDVLVQMRLLLMESGLSGGRNANGGLVDRSTSSNRLGVSMQPFNVAEYQR